MPAKIGQKNLHQLNLFTRSRSLPGRQWGFLKEQYQLSAALRGLTPETRCKYIHVSSEPASLLATVSGVSPHIPALLCGFKRCILPT